MYLFRAVDTSGQTVDFYLSQTRDREAAKAFLKRVMANPDNSPFHVCRVMATGAIRPRFANCSASAMFIEDDGNEPGDTAITELNPTTAKSNGTCARCKGREPQRRAASDSGLIFPTEGCWEITGKVGDATLTFVNMVIRAE